MQIRGLGPTAEFMRHSAVTLAVLAVLLTGSVPSARRAAQNPDRRLTGAIRGAVTDGSGGVLPGVTVVAMAADNTILATATTDGLGIFGIRDIPAGTITLVFQLEGFADDTASIVVQPGEESRTSQRLRVAPLSETVVVHAAGGVQLPRFPPVPPPPPLVARPLPEHDRAAVCGPAKPDLVPESVGTIKARRYQAQGDLFLAGAELIVSGGLEEGLLVGRNLVARRNYHVRGSTGADMLAEHSAGVVQIVTATDHSSLAVVVYACDALRKGDFLASFRPEPAPDPEPPGTPAYNEAARILFADDGQTLGMPERMMVIDRGAGKGIHVGQRFTLFRQTSGPVKHVPAGEAIAVSVKTDSATIRIERVIDAVAAGDWAAPQSTTSAANAIGR
jgi:Carboxypeptidase regulatory-like domain